MAYYQGGTRQAPPPMAYYPGVCDCGLRQRSTQCVTHPVLTVCGYPIPYYLCRV